MVRHVTAAGEWIVGTQVELGIKPQGRLDCCLSRAQCQRLFDHERIDQGRDWINDRRSRLRLEDDGVCGSGIDIDPARSHDRSRCIRRDGKDTLRVGFSRRLAGVQNPILVDIHKDGRVFDQSVLNNPGLVAGGR